MMGLTLAFILGVLAGIACTGLGLLLWAIYDTPSKDVEPYDYYGFKKQQKSAGTPDKRACGYCIHEKDCYRRGQYVLDWAARETGGTKKLAKNCKDYEQDPKA